MTSTVTVRLNASRVVPDHNGAGPTTDWARSEGLDVSDVLADHLLYISVDGDAHCVAGLKIQRDSRGRRLLNDRGEGYAVEPFNQRVHTAPPRLAPIKG